MMPTARMAHRVTGNVEIYRCPSAEKAQLAAQIRKAGGDVPAHLRPASIGRFGVKAMSDAQARRDVQALVDHQAKLHRCRVRSISRTQNGWVAYLAEITR